MGYCRVLPSILLHVARSWCSFNVTGHWISKQQGGQVEGQLVWSIPSSIGDLGRSRLPKACSHRLRDEESRLANGQQAVGFHLQLPSDRGLLLSSHNLDVALGTGSMETH